MFASTDVASVARASRRSGLQPAGPLQAKESVIGQTLFTMILALAILTTALLFGGMALYSFGFAAFLFSALPPDVAGATLRRAFPAFYLFVMGAAALAAALLWSHDGLAAGLMAGVAVTTLPSRQLLMPAINAATDRAQRGRFRWLHGLSIVVTLAHIGAAGYVLVRLV